MHQIIYNFNHLTDSYVDFWDLYIVLRDLYVDFSDGYVNLLLIHVSKNFKQKQNVEHALYLPSSFHCIFWQMDVSADKTT